MRSFPRDLTGDFPPGTWRAINRDGELAANFSCPDCGTRAGLGYDTNHTIALDGTVNPSVVCDTGGCSFHEFIKLDGWIEAAAERARRAAEKVMNDARVDPEILRKPTTI